MRDRYYCRHWLLCVSFLLLPACGNTPLPGSASDAPPMHSLVDQFAGESIDTSSWAFFDATTGVPARAGARVAAGVAQEDAILITLAPDTAEYGGLISRQPHQFAGSSFLVEVSQVATGGPTTETFVGVTTADQEEFVLITSLADRIEAWYRWRSRDCNERGHRRIVGGVTFCRLGGIPFDATKHRFRRLREVRGVVLFELSTDGAAWYQPNGWRLKHRFTDAGALHGLLGAGAYVADPESGTARFEHVNARVPAATRDTPARAAPDTATTGT
jgi:hypothetical protein